MLDRAATGCYKRGRAKTGAKSEPSVGGWTFQQRPKNERLLAGFASDRARGEYSESFAWTRGKERTSTRDDKNEDAEHRARQENDRGMMDGIGTGGQGLLKLLMWH